MLSTAIFDKRLVKIRVAVHTAVPACVICAKVYTGNTPAGSPLILISFHVKPEAANAFEALRIYTTGMTNPILLKVNILGTGVDRDSMLPCNISEMFRQLLRLFSGRRANAKRRNTASYIFI